VRIPGILFSCAVALSAQPIVIRNVDVYPVNGAEMKGVSLVLQDGRIAEIGARIVPAKGARIIEGLEQSIAWTKGGNNRVRVTVVAAPKVNVRRVRRKMGLSQAQFATRFGLPPATLKNWEQGRSHPDSPARVLLAVIAKHPEAVKELSAILAQAKRECGVDVAASSGTPFPA